MKRLSRTLLLARGWIRFAAGTLAIFLALRIFAVDAYLIPTSSMEKTLLVGDYLLVNKALFGAEVPGTEMSLPSLRDPQRGEVVVFRPPHDPERSYVKRVVGVPGFKHIPDRVDGQPKDFSEVIEHAKKLPS
ncbi:MAG: signal peptidase I, partial [Longimicrobiales bacterium]